MRRNPNIVLTGKILTGKSTIARSLSDAFGYININTGTYLRDHLAQTTPLERDLTHDDYQAAREELIERYGPLYFLHNYTEDSVPTVVDGVRSAKVMASLAIRGFNGILITSDDQIRLRRAQSLAAIDLGKHVIHSLADIHHIDAAQDSDLTMISPFITHTFVNDGKRSIHDLCADIIDRCMNTST